jgi:hypothetical protein
MNTVTTDRANEILRRLFTNLTRNTLEQFAAELGIEELPRSNRLLLERIRQAAAQVVAD